MDECLNEDDTEEPHRRFSDCFDAQHAGLSMHAGSMFAAADALQDRTTGKAPIARPAFDHGPRVPARFYGRSTG
ncbi:MULTISPECIES: hypothetical protein [unclassified Methanoregula]|uniref:hypothetical protein n=1 Tax=unclassified Methanoregula TaxID=2649730 RepID=UPI0025DEB018|nr:MULTISPECIES: hypothetical protein [unclassified Methanoregula]